MRGARTSRSTVHDLVERLLLAAVLLGVQNGEGIDAGLQTDSWVPRFRVKGSLGLLSEPPSSPKDEQQGARELPSHAGKGPAAPSLLVIVISLQPQNYFLCVAPHGFY